MKKIFTQKQIQAAVKDIAQMIDIDKELQGEIVVVCNLKGAFIFCADLLRVMKNKNVHVVFTQARSYGEARTSSYVINYELHLQRKEIKDKNILVVEDIIDTGNLLDWLIPHLRDDLKAGSIRVACLLQKRRKIKERKNHANYWALECDADDFVIGYGLDDKEMQRGLPDIYKI